LLANVVRSMRKVAAELCVLFAFPALSAFAGVPSLPRIDA